ncbi:MAG TPA: hypothetical protein VG028_20980 [Terriglobia bacterium]|nr:hypothetical protein [Terriglobia bacterium]
MKDFLVVCFLILLTVLIAPRAVAQTPTNSGELEKLSAFLGTWATKGEMRDTPYSKAQANITSVLTCQWAPNHGFLICDQVIHTPAGANNDLSVYTYNESTRQFSFFGIGRNDARARTPALAIEGNTWTYLGGFDNGSKHIQFRTSNTFTNARSIAWRSEYSEDGTHWMLMGEGTDSRED